RIGREQVALAKPGEEAAKLRQSSPLRAEAQLPARPRVAVVVQVTLIQFEDLLADLLGPFELALLAPVDEPVDVAPPVVDGALGVVADAKMLDVAVPQ